MLIWVSVVVYCANKSCTQAGTSLNHCNTINTLKGLKNRTISLISTHMSCYVWPIVVAPLSGKNINTSIGKPGLFSYQPTGGRWRDVTTCVPDHHNCLYSQRVQDPPKRGSHAVLCRKLLWKQRVRLVWRHKTTNFLWQKLFLYRSTGGLEIIATAS